MNFICLHVYASFLWGQVWPWIQGDLDTLIFRKRETRPSYILLRSSIRSLPDFPTHDHCSPNPLPPNLLLRAKRESRSWSLHWKAPSLPHARASGMLSSQILLNSCWLPCTAARRCKPADWQWLAPASCVDMTLLKCKARYITEEFPWKKDSLSTQINMAELRTRVSFWFVSKNFNFYFEEAPTGKSPSPYSTV